MSLPSSPEVKGASPICIGAAANGVPSALTNTSYWLSGTAVTVGVGVAVSTGAEVCVAVEVAVIVGLFVGVRV